MLQLPKQAPDMSEPPMPEGPMPPMNGGAPEPPMDGPEPPMDDEPPMDEPDNGGENKEIDDIFGKLDTEKQAAVIKYAKSMVNDSDESEPPMDDESEDPDMPMESVKNLQSIISEIVNNILDSENEEERDDDKIRNTKVTKANPIITKRQNV